MVSTTTGQVLTHTTRHWKTLKKRLLHNLLTLFCSKNKIGLKIALTNKTNPITMKKLTYSLLAILTIAALTVSCSKKSVMPKGEEEVVVPCSGPDFFTTNKFFRA